MGINKFKNQLLKNAKVKYGDVKPGTYPEKISGLMIDLNDLLHFYAQKTYQYGSFGNPTPALKTAMMKKSDAELETVFIKSLLARLDFYISNLEPEDYFIVAVDGPVPVAKIAQQRMRRFKDSKSTTPRFDNAVISPGTEFMEKVHLKLKEWFLDKASKDQLPKVSMYSSFHEPGEGEHKMVDMFRTVSDKLYKTDSYPNNPLPTGLHFMCGQDSDLMMIGTLIPYKNVVFYYEDRDKESRTGVPDITLYTIDAWKKFLYRSFLRDRIEADYVLSFFMFGNDFIPKNPALSEADTSHENISNAYINNGKRLVDVRTGKIIRANFLEFLSYFVAMEKENLDSKAGQYNATKMHPYPILTNNTKKNKYNRIEVDMDGFKKDWYERALQNYNEMAFLSCKGDLDACEKVRYKDIDVFKKDMFENYLEMLQWNLDYYLGKPVSWNFQYRFYFAPLISDIASLPLEGEILRNNDDHWKKESSILRQIIMMSHPAKVKDFTPIKFHGIFDYTEIKNVSPLKPIYYEDGIYSDPKNDYKFTIVLPLVYHDYFNDVISKFKGGIPNRMIVSFDAPDMYVKESGASDSDRGGAGGEPVGELIRGSKTRIISSKKYEWVGIVE